MPWNRSSRNIGLVVGAAVLAYVSLTGGCPQTVPDAGGGMQDGDGSQTGTSQTLEEQIRQIVNQELSARSSPGEPGAAGPQGADGSQGQEGSQGAAGANGATGAQGDQGLQGPVGAMGVQGDQGSQGPQGDQGPAGASPFELIGDDAVYTQGKVGIGTDAPAADLHVAGSFLVRGDQTGLSIFAGATSTTLGFTDQTGGGSNLRFKWAKTWVAHGNFGIGREPLTHGLEVSGNASKSVAGNWLANSDARIKTDVENVTGALETLDKVRLVSFNYSDEYRAKHPSVEARRYLNIIAQEFATVFPDAVCSSGEKLKNGGEILQADTYPLTIYSAAAIQELHRQVREKDARIVSLEARMARMEALLSNTAATNDK